MKDVHNNSTNNNNNKNNNNNSDNNNSDNNNNNKNNNNSTNNNNNKNNNNNSDNNNNTIHTLFPGPPKMKLKITTKIVDLDSTIGINCQLCQSNPASTIEWLFNGKPLIFKPKRMHNISQPCYENLFLLSAYREDEGNYTCIARNEFGVANSTTRINVVGKETGKNFY